jgi:hypothetical protein
MKQNNIILTSYYLNIPDPQRNIYVKENFDYIKTFYDSIVNYDLNCIIFYDFLSNDFIDKYETDKISFIKFNHDDYFTNSGNDTRNLVYLKHLNHNLYDNIIISDINGIEFLSNPFEDLNEDRVYVATSRRKTVKGKVRDLTHDWFKQYAIRAYGNFDLFEKFKNNYSLTCKFFGGNYNIILEILTEFENEFYKVDLNHNTNYAVFNYIMYSKFHDRMIKGYSTNDGYCETHYINTKYIVSIRNADVFGKLFWDTDCNISNKYISFKKFISPKSETLIIAFSGIPKNKLKVLEFSNFFINNRDFSKKSDIYLFADYSASWYHHGITEITKNINDTIKYLDDIIKSKNYKKVLFIGVSAGGYAAILFGSLCKVTNVLAFIPRTVVPPSKCPDDALDSEKQMFNNHSENKGPQYSWRKYYSATAKKKMFNKRFHDLKPYINNITQYTLHGDLSENNKYHHHHISQCHHIKDFDNVTIVEHEELNLKNMRDTGELKNMVLNLLN